MIESKPNAYSQRWFRFFHDGIAETRTTQETDFICAAAPLPQFGRVLDLCCGTGRHARALAARGYSVVGVERDAAAVARARELGGGPTYVEADIRDFMPAHGEHDAAVIMSQSFGYFDPATNQAVLARIGSGLRIGGRVIVDLWHPGFFEAHQGEREFPSTEGAIREHKRVEDGRLFVQLDYPGGGEESFEWQLFTPAEMRAMAGPIGLRLVAACTDFDLEVAPTETKPRIQFVLERR